ncbi:MAG: hypothetical protein ABSG46_06985 [Candidatus Binataceae bacterium]
MAAISPKSLELHRTLRLQLIGENEQERAKVRTVLAKITDPVLEISDMAANDATQGWLEADLSFVIFSSEEAAPLGYLQSRSEQKPRPLICALLHDRSPALMRRVLHAGADELMFLPLDEAEVARILMKHSERQRKAARHDGGVLYSLTSLTGGAGVSTLSANLALALGYIQGKSTAAVDMDFQNGGLAIALQLEPAETILPLVDYARKLDSIQLEASLTKHPMGIYLLAAPKRLEDAERISETTVIAVLNLMRQLFDFVIVDCGQRVDENAIAAWERSSGILYLIDQSLAAARSVRRFTDLFNQLGLHGTDPRYILNAFDAQSPITEARLAERMGQPFFAKIPRDDKLLERAQLRKQSVWQAGANSSYVRAIESLAGRLRAARRDATAPAEAGLFERLWGMFGARAAS